MPRANPFLLSLLALCVVATAAHAQRLGPITSTDITFYFGSDLHFGDQRCQSDAEAANRRVKDDMAHMPQLTWPNVTWDVATHKPVASLRGVVGTPMGVLLAGDLTHFAGKHDWDGMTQSEAEVWGQQVAKGLTFGKAGGCPCQKGSPCLPGFGSVYLTGMPFPVYEGYGNHDVHLGANGADAKDLDASSRIQARTAKGRPGLKNPGQHGYYSWDMGGVHFVNLNAYAGGVTKTSNSGLAFLTADLARYATGGKRVVLMQHYGFQNKCYGLMTGAPDATWSQPLYSQNTGCESSVSGYWSTAEQAAFLQAIKPYNVIAILAGHDHYAHTYLTSTGVRVIHNGRTGSGQWSVVRIRDNDLVVWPVDRGNGHRQQEAYVFPISSAALAKK